MSKVIGKFYPPYILVFHVSIVALVLWAEKFLIGSHIYAAVKMSHESPLAAMLFYYGQALSGTTVLAGVILILLINKKIKGYFVFYCSTYSAKHALFLVPQAFAFLLFYSVTTLAFESGEGFNFYQLLWMLNGIALVLLSAFAIAPYGFWKKILIEQKFSVFLALGIGLIIWLVSNASQGLWDYFANTTFALVGHILSLVETNVYLDYGQRIIGVNEFFVRVDQQCSGYEGIGLVTAFVLVFLFSFRDDFKFPVSFLLIPVGALVIWLFNLLRIAVLILIGSHWSADIAIKGFHSQAGWIAFILTSIGLMWLAHNSRFFTKKISRSPQAVTAGINLPVATLLPLITLLMMTIITAALSGEFDWLYPLRVVAVILVIAFVFKSLDLLPLKWNCYSVFAGILVAAIWIALVEHDSNMDSIYQQTIDETNSSLVFVWMLFRFVGSVITVPIAEELGFRAYLLCRLSSQPVSTRGCIRISFLGFVVSSIAFGLLHGAWIAGTLAGLIYAFVRYKSAHVLDPIIAHGTTNLFLIFYVLYTDHWSLL